MHALHERRRLQATQSCMCSAAIDRSGACLASGERKASAWQGGGAGVPCVNGGWEEVRDVVVRMRRGEGVTYTSRGHESAKVSAKGSAVAAKSRS